MSKLGNAIRILGVPCIVAGFATGGLAASGTAAKPSGAVKMAVATETAPALPASAAAPSVAQGPVVSVPACARKVKVVYAGYGEADRAGCSVASAEAPR